MSIEPDDQIIVRVPGERGVTIEGVPLNPGDTFKAKRENGQ